MRTAALALLVLVATASATTPPGSTVRLGATTGYLARPQTTGAHPAIIVIHAWWGLNAWVRQQADRLAAEGYVALAPDLFHGHVATTAAQARTQVRNLDAAQALRDLQAAYAYLDRRSDVRHNDIGVIGWCFGGGWAAQLAAAAPNLKACVIYYGDIPKDAATVRHIQAPVLGNFGGADRGIPPARVERFAAELRAAGHTPDIKIYPGMPHAFAGSRATQPTELSAARDAWGRTLRFLRQHLGR